MCDMDKAIEILNIELESLKSDYKEAKELNGGIDGGTKIYGLKEQIIEVKYLLAKLNECIRIMGV